MQSMPSDRRLTARDKSLQKAVDQEVRPPPRPALGMLVNGSLAPARNKLAMTGLVVDHDDAQHTGANVERIRTRRSDAVRADTGWRPLFRLGGVSGGLFVMLLIAAIGLSIATPLH